LSWFQPIVCGFSAGIICLAQLFLRMFYKVKRKENYVREIGWIIVLLACMGLSFFMLGLNREIQGGIDWLVKRDKFLVHVVENQPLNTQSAVEDFGYLVFLFPFVIFIFTVKLLKKRKEIHAAFFIAWSTVTGMAVLFQERFADLFSFSAVICIVVVAEYSYLWFRFLRLKSAIVRRIPHIILGGTVIIFSMTFIPPLRWLYNYVRTSNLIHADIEMESHMACWVRENTPITSGFWDTKAKPEYSVLASWSRGNMFTYISQRPNVANNIGGYPDTREANIAPYRFFTATNLSEGEAILQRYGVKYIVVEEMLLSGAFGRMLDILEKRHDDFFNATNTTEGILYTPKMAFYATLASKLYLQNGVGMKGFKLVYESPYKKKIVGQPRPLLKIFEYSPSD